jgi:RNA-directed DNA polymerase
LNVQASKKAVKREREKLRQMTSRAQGQKPIPALIQELNRRLGSWARYIRFGYPRRAFDQINEHVQTRLRRHLWRRSQRPFRSPEGVSEYENFKRLGLKFL